MLSLTVVERLLRSQHDFGEAVLVDILESHQGVYSKFGSGARMTCSNASLARSAKSNVSGTVAV